ncbi:MAG TPA: hypothetical protein VJO14_05600 [Bacteroidota bacterium]|nr:hypothetical protein [Bacteroidota bacterium]
MKRLSLAATILLAAGLCSSQTAGRAGVFARMGFGARGMGMGNAMTAVIRGDVLSYYNPAAPAFGTVRHAGVSFGLLSLDRYLNFLNFTQPIQPSGGLSVGLINAGVRDIDGRDSDGEKIGLYSTYENQVTLSFSNRVDDNVSIGMTMKLYHSKLFDEVTTTTVGFDGGILVQPVKSFTVGIVLQDIGSKYKWNTKDVNSTGRETDDKFPMLKRLGLACSLPGEQGVVAVDFEQTSGGSVVIRSGVEYSPEEHFSLRGGADRIDFGDGATGVKPTFGFTVINPLGGWTPSLSYAFSGESFAPRGFHMITLSAIF